LYGFKVLTSSFHSNLVVVTSTELLLYHMAELLVDLPQLNFLITAELGIGCTPLSGTATGRQSTPAAVRQLQQSTPGACKLDVPFTTAADPVEAVTEAALTFAYSVGNFSEALLAVNEAAKKPAEELNSLFNTWSKFWDLMPDVFDGLTFIAPVFDGIGKALKNVKYETHH
jgi:hypothetical protein